MRGEGCRRPSSCPDSALASVTGSYANSDARYDVAVSGRGLAATFEDGEFAARPIGERMFEITTGGPRAGDRFDFPVAGFGRFDSGLAERVA